MIKTFCHLKKFLKKLKKLLKVIYNQVENVNFEKDLVENGQLKQFVKILSILIKSLFMREKNKK